MENQKIYDAVILGGGLAGLTAAANLAKQGKRVAVLEKGKTLGGRASTKEISGSFFNLGPHALYQNGLTIKHLEELGVEIKGGPPKAKGGQVYYQGVAYDLPSNLLSLFKTKLLNWKEKKEFATLMLNMGKIKPEDFYDLTLQQWVENQINSPKNRDLFYMYARLSGYSNAPHLVSAGIVLRQLKLSLTGAVYVNRGWQTIINQLLELANKYGVSIIQSCHIEQLVLDRTLQTVIYTHNQNTQHIQTRWIISTIPPKALLELVPEIKEKSLGKLLAGSIPVKAACLDLTLKRLPQTNRHFALDVNDSLYYSNHSNAAKLTYHPEHQVIHVMKYLKPDEQADDHVLQDLYAFLELNQPSWREQLVTERYLPQLVVSHRLPVVGSPDPAAQVQQSFPGLLVAGEWTSNQYILADAAVVTALEASKIILEKERVMHAYSS